MPAPKNPNVGPAVEARRRAADEKAVARLRARGWTCTPPGNSSNWDTAIDWLLNSRHTADPDIQTAFWAVADGIATADEVEDLPPSELRERRKDPTLPDSD